MQVSDGISHPKLRETVSLIAPLIASDDLADELADGVALSLSLSRLAAWQVALLQSHFHEHGQQSRVMVFCSYRYGACRSSFDGPSLSAC